MNISTNPLFTHSIEKLCTICYVILTDRDTSQSIFSALQELESPMNVLKVLQSFSNFNCYNGPQMVCSTCYNKTIEVYNFIQMCNKAHDKMQHYLKNVEATKTIQDVETDVKVEEISIEPTRIITDEREFLEEMENEKISKFDELGIVISGTEIKIEERVLQGIEEETNSNEEITISHTEIVTEGKTDSSYFDNLKVKKVDAQLHNERMGLIKCKDCHLMFSDKKKLSDHRKDAKHTKEKPFLREMSNSFSRTKYNLRSRDQRYSAKRAHISEDLRLNQDRHQLLRDQGFDVKCPECQEVFYNDKQLKIHMTRRHKRKFMRNDCGKMFTTKHNLNTHSRVHTDIGEKLFTCLICKSDFAAQSPLRGHMDSHNVKKAHKCEQCDRRFIRAEHLRRHMDIHNGVKAQKCEQCDRRFTRADNLRTHMTIHNGVKAHKCEQCDRRFTWTANLRTHMNILHGVKAHKCEQCNQQFTQAGSVMKIHNKIKAHKCEQCDRRFDRAERLRSHMDMHKRAEAR